MEASSHGRYERRGTCSTGEKEMSNEQLVVWRCGSCHRILAEHDISNGGTIRVKCHSCNSYNTTQTNAGAADARTWVQEQPRRN